MAFITEMLPQANTDWIPASARRTRLEPVSGESDVVLTTTDRTSPNLDTLPNEVVQKIFWESLELNLIKTFTSIAYSLPNFWHVARSLVLLTFCRVDAASQLNWCPYCTYSFVGLDGPLSKDARRKLQKRVLEGSWLTIGMLKLAMGEIQEAYVQEYWVDAGIRTLPPSEAAFENRWLDSEDVLARKLELYGVDPIGAAMSLTMEDPFYMQLNGIEELDDDLYDIFSILEVDFIPDKLLELPITNSKLEFLHFLLRSKSGAVVWEISHSESAMRHAIQHAISTGKLELTCLLIDLRLRSNSCSKSSRVSVDNFLTAAKYDHAQVLHILVEFDSTNFPRNDPDLEQWARSVKDKGDNFGHMLLEYMQANHIIPDRHSFAMFEHERHFFPCHIPLSATVRARDVIDRLGERFGIEPGNWLSG